MDHTTPHHTTRLSFPVLGIHYHFILFDLLLQPFCFEQIAIEQPLFAMAPLFSVLFIFMLLSHIPTFVTAHGLLYNPPQRGCLNGNQYAPVPIYDRKARVDYEAHFPAGDKSLVLGAGFKSQKKAAGSRGWTPYEPWKRTFRWRAGVCGDLLWKSDHLRGGKYYNGGRIVKTYRQGDVVSFDVTVTTHHNGFFSFAICDISKCGGEIGANCFRNGHCHYLKRAWVASCESRRDWKCAPIDRAYPERWYLPCTNPNAKIDHYGGGKMLYHLPKDLHCEHCVLQWYWASANSCNPPGLVNFFKSNRSPKWGNCKGQGEAIGGWRRWEQQCGGKRFSEEFYQCSDVRILPRLQQNKQKKKNNRNKQNKRGEVPRKLPRWWGKNRGPLMKIVILGNGRPILDMYHASSYMINVKSCKQITFRVETFRNVKGGVAFYFNGKLWWNERSRPYVFGGNNGVWQKPWFNRGFELGVLGEQNWLAIKLVLKR